MTFYQSLVMTVLFIELVIGLTAGVTLGYLWATWAWEERGPK